MGVICWESHVPHLTIWDGLVIHSHFGLDNVNTCNEGMNEWLGHIFLYPIALKLQVFLGFLARSPNWLLTERRKKFLDKYQIDRKRKKGRQKRRFLSKNLYCSLQFLVHHVEKWALNACSISRYWGLCIPASMRTIIPKADPFSMEKWLICHSEKNSLLHSRAQKINRSK